MLSENPHQPNCMLLLHVTQGKEGGFVTIKVSCAEAGVNNRAQLSRTGSTPSCIRAMAAQSPVNSILTGY